MKLSIIVPVYNVKPYLDECLSSLVKQTIDDYEIILVDDGSTDGSADIIRDYELRFPQLIKTMRVDNGGQGRARNFGIDIAQGDYLGFIDSDDWIDTQMYEKMYEKAVRTNADVVVCDFMEKFADGRENYLPASIQDEKLSSAGSSCNKIFRASLVEELRFPVGLWYEDFYFSAMMLMKSRRTEFIKEPLYIYRRGQESTMHNNNASKNLDIITIMDMLAEYMLPRDMTDEFEHLLINHIGIDAINRIASQLVPDKIVIKHLCRYMKKRIPKLTASNAFKRESLKRRIICWLNCKGCVWLSQELLKLKVSAGRVFIGP